MAKTQTTTGTGKWPFIRVYNDVPLQLTSGAEPLSALVADVRLLVCMSWHMGQQFLPPPETFAAVLTLMWEIVGMSAVVLVKSRFRLEHYATSVTDVRTFARVCSVVVL